MGFKYGLTKNMIIIKPIKTLVDLSNKKPSLHHEASGEGSYPNPINM